MSDPILFTPDGVRVVSWIGERHWRFYGPRMALAEPRMSVPSHFADWSVRYVATRDRTGWRIRSVPSKPLVGPVRRDVIDRWSLVPFDRLAGKRFPTTASLEMFMRMVRP